MTKYKQENKNTWLMPVGLSSICLLVGLIIKGFLGFALIGFGLGFLATYFLTRKRK